MAYIAGPKSENKLIKIYTSENIVLLEILKSKLEDESIACKINYAFLPAAGEIQRVVACPELCILNNEQANLAKKIVERELADQKNVLSDWKCPECGENLEGQFKVCWKCGHSKE